MALREDLAETESFALYFSGNEWALSTPHLYISALATWPRDLRPCQGWRRHFPGIPGFVNGLLGDMPLTTLWVGSEVHTVACSSNDRHIASGSGDKLVRVWDASTGETLKVLEGHTDDVTSVAFSSDDRRIVSGSGDKSVQVWDASTGETLRVAFSSDDSHIVSSSLDKSVRVWDPSTGETLEVLEGHTSYVRSVALSSDDRQIVSGFGNKSVPVWTLPTQHTPFCYIRQKTADSSGYQTPTGWLLSPQQEHYLMFVPPIANLPDSSNILTLPQSYSASVDFTSSTLGHKWNNCFSS